MPGWRWERRGRTSTPSESVAKSAYTTTGGFRDRFYLERTTLSRQRGFSGVCVAGRSARPRSPGTPGLSTRAFRVRLRQSHMWGPQDPAMLGLPMATLGGPTTTTRGPATDSSSTQSLSAGEPSHGPVLCEKELSFPYTFHIFTTVSNNFQFACKELLWFSCALLCSASLSITHYSPLTVIPTSPAAVAVRGTTTPHTVILEKETVCEIIISSNHFVFLSYYVSLHTQM